MSTNILAPNREERWVDLLIAIIELARREANKPTAPEPTKQEAAEFLRWAEETIDEDGRSD